MAEATLSVAYEDLQKDVGQLLGYGRDTADTNRWTTDVTTEVDEIIKAATRRFYNPGLIMGQGQPAHRWSFLRPLATIVVNADIAVDSDVTVTGEADGTVTATGGTPFFASLVGRSIVITGDATYTISGYTSSTVITVSTDASSASGATFSITTEGLYGLPDDFGGWGGSIVLSPDDNAGPRIQIVPDEHIRYLRQEGSDTVGTPRYASLLPRAFTPETGQRWDMRLWPTPDGEFTLQYRKFIQYDKMAATHYVAGGPPAAEALRLCCRAEADARINDATGQWEQRAQQALVNAIAWDRSNGPEFLGYNGDGSDGPMGWADRDKLHPFPDRYTTYDDGTYGP